MAETKFTPIFNLNDLSVEQRQDYYLAACKYFGVPPELNVLRLTFVDVDNGPANLVLCATKGATDIIRNNLDISVKSLTDKVVNGSYVVTATGENGKGRAEMAFGSFYIEGLKGKNLDNAIMTAQTRALKRMTLQFAGGGLTDESEVEAVASAPKYAPAQQPAIQPAARPNTAAGEVAVSPYVAVTGDKEKDFPKDAHLFPTVAQVEAQRALAVVKPDVLAKQAGEIMENATRDAITDLGKQMEKENKIVKILTEEPKRRKRTTFNKQFSLQPESPNADIPQSQPSPTSEPLKTVVVYEAPLVAAKPTTQAIAEAQKIPVEIQVPAPTVDPVKLNELRNQLFKYTNGLLPKAGLVSDEGAPLMMKLRKFVVNRYKGLPSLNHLSIEQWQDLYSFMDSYFDNGRGAELVKIIDESWTNA